MDNPNKAQQLGDSPNAAKELVQHIDPAGAIEETRDATARLTRAGLFRTGAMAGTAIAGTALAGGRTSCALAADRKSGDVAILNYALSLEYLQAAFYTEAQRRGALTGGLAEQAKVVGSHERVHVAALRQQLASAAVKSPTFDFHGTTENPQKFRETAVAFEDLTVAAYQEKAPLIASRGYLVALVAIQSVEARHASWIRRLAGVVPAPTAFDEPLGQPRVEELIDATHFIVGRPRTGTNANPHFTG